MRFMRQAPVSANEKTQGFPYSSHQPAYTFHMNNHKVSFVFSNKIYHLQAANNRLTVYQEDGAVCRHCDADALKKEDDAFSQLILSIYRALF